MREAQPCRLLFLDIDGVIRTWPYTCPTYTNTHGRKVLSHNTQAVAALNWLYRMTNADLVITSTWRELGKKRMQECLADWGVHWPITSMLRPDIRHANPGTTAWFMNGRSWQISDWLELYHARHPKAVIHAVAIDDDPLELLGLCHFVQTTDEQGLTWEQAGEVRDYLMERAHE